MTRPSPFSVRGRRALMVMRDEREISIVRRQLSRLGMTISEHDPAEPPPPNQAVDVILMDADSIPIKSDHGHLVERQRADHRADRNGNAQPVEVAARSAAGLFSHQAAAFGRTLHRAGGCVRFSAAKSRRSRAHRKAGGPYSIPARCVRRRSADHARSRHVGDGRVFAYSTDRDAASHDDRGLERGNHRGRWNAEPDDTDRVAIVALKIADALHAGRGHPCPGGVERARQIDGPASGLDKHGVEAEPAGVHRGIMHAKIGG